MPNDHRVDLAGVSALIGVGVRTVEKYRSTIYVPGGREPIFPAADGDGLYDPDQIQAWNDSRKGLTGRPRGEASGKACDNCGTVVPRRDRPWTPDGELESTEMWCRPCLVQQPGLPVGYLFRWERRSDSKRPRLNG